MTVKLPGRAGIKLCDDGPGTVLQNHLIAVQIPRRDSGQCWRGTTSGISPVAAGPGRECHKRHAAVTRGRQLPTAQKIGSANLFRIGRCSNRIARKVRWSSVRVGQGCTRWRCVGIKRIKCPGSDRRRRRCRQRSRVVPVARKPLASGRQNHQTNNQNELSRTHHDESIPHLRPHMVHLLAHNLSKIQNHEKNAQKSRVPFCHERQRQQSGNVPCRRRRRYLGWCQQPVDRGPDLQEISGTCCKPLPMWWLIDQRQISQVNDPVGNNRIGQQKDVDRLWRLTLGIHTRGSQKCFDMSAQSARWCRGRGKGSYQTFCSRIQAGFRERATQNIVRTQKKQGGVRQIVTPSQNNRNDTPAATCSYPSFWKRL